MLVYRVSNTKYATDLSGRGAFLYGGRWNSSGVSALYTSENRSLALLELMAHIPPKLIAEGDFTILTISLPDSLELKTSPNPKLLNKTNSQNWGDTFLKDTSKLAFKTPSIIMPKECNIIINPCFKFKEKIALVALEQLDFDLRLSLLSF